MSGGANTVVVVGGGLGGLAAATSLQRAGLSVVVLEKADHPGGRSCGDRVAGYPMERRLPVVLTGDANLLGWIDELGLRDLCLPLRPVQLAHRYRGRTRAVHTRSLRGLAATPGLGLHDGLRLVRLPRLMRRYRPLLDPLAPERAADLDDRSVADFARLYFGPRVLERWIAPMLAETSGDSAEAASRVAFLLQWMGEEAGSFALLRSGLDEVLRAASERLSMRYGMAVERIARREDGGFEITCEGKPEPREVFEAGAVVVAVAATEARRIVAPCLLRPERDALAPFRYAPGATLALASSRVPSAVPQLIRVPASEQSPIQSYLVEPGEPDGRAPEGAGMVTLAAREDYLSLRKDISDEVLEKDLRIAFGEIDPATASAIKFSRLSRASEALPCMDVGTYRRLARLRKLEKVLRAEGRRLYFAGDYLSGARVDDAVASGRRAARALLEDRR